MVPSPLCFQLVKRFEPLRLTVTRDSASDPTIGYGHVAPDADLSITPEQADDLLSRDLNALGDIISRRAEADGVILSQGMFDALTDFAYNLGYRALFNSYMWDVLTDNTIAPDSRVTLAARDLLLWDKSRDPKTKKMVTVPYLTERREAEKELFLS